MTIFDVLTMIGGLSLFLFGMNVMGQALERRAGNGLRSILGKLTNNKFFGFLTGLAVTAIIQSSSATTVMVVGFVNSGLIELGQAINVIIGANVGTTVTAWILSLSGISGESLILQLLKPTSFSPIIAIIGVVLYVFCKGNKKKDTGLILLGFATLMFGMETMTDAVSVLADVPAFAQLFLLFENPVLGLIAGAILTAIIQSSSASVGILQALASTGQISYSACIPLIMGQNIGTCITALISSVGTNKNAKRTAVVHLAFNVIGSLVGIALFCLVDWIFSPAIFGEAANYLGIAVCHTAFNILCTAILLPNSKLLEKLARKIVPDDKNNKIDKTTELDPRLMTTPSIALQQGHDFTLKMADVSVLALKKSIDCINDYSAEKLDEIKQLEELSDHYEDILSSYLVSLSSKKLSEAESSEVSKLLKIIGDLERISDHSVNLAESFDEIERKQLVLSDFAKNELKTLMSAVNEVLDQTLNALKTGNVHSAYTVEPLEQVVDDLKEQIRTRHILRLQQGECTISAGFVLSDILTNLERTSDHCSNICACVIDMIHTNMNLHASVRAIRTNSDEYRENYKAYLEKYSLPVV